MVGSSFNRKGTTVKGKIFFSFTVPTKQFFLGLRKIPSHVERENALFGFHIDRFHCHATKK